jgi:CubicO group peptidase (beta-lactamase class C family)
MIATIARCRITRCCALVLLATSGHTSLAAAQSAPMARSFPPDSVVLEIIKQRVDGGRVAGIVVGLLAPDGTRRIVAYGDPGPGQPPLDGNSVFEIGSMTKVFTGTLLAQMTLDGEVGLDDPLATFLPATVTVPQRNGRQITLRLLSTHRSGLPRDPASAVANFYADFTVSRMYEWLSTYTLPRDPGAEFEYSNIGVALLGHALSRAAGRPWDELQRERIWTPLGMTGTSTVLTPWQREHLALGHSPGGDVVSYRARPHPVLSPAGGIRSTANDMLTFLAAQIAPPPTPLHAAMELATQPQSVDSSGKAMGLNWAIDHTGADTVVWHNGGTTGYRTWFGFVRSSRMAVVVLANSSGTPMDDIGHHLLDANRPLQEYPGSSRRTLLAWLVALGGTIGMICVAFWWRRSRTSRGAVPGGSAGAA